MKSHFSFWSARWFCILSILENVEVQGQNSNLAGSALASGSVSACGGVVELSSGILDFSPADQNGEDFCIWVIKLPVTSQNIQFQLTKIPSSSRLNLYSQEGQNSGQITIFPVASLTAADINSTVDINSSNVIAIWAPSSVKYENQKEDDDSSGLLSFTWDGLTAQSQSQSQEEGKEIPTRDLNLVGGVNYVEADRGRFSWVRPGKSQQSLLWVLNSKSAAADSNSDSNSLTLKIETEFEKCDLVDPCLCSYFGVYEVHNDFLRAVSTECSRSSNLQVTGVRPRLVALGFVNPEFRRDTNHVTLSWSREEPEEGTTTTQTTQTTTSTTTEAPKTCPSASPYPKSCSDIQFESGSNSSEFQNCLIYPDGPSGDSVEVLCDFEVDGGGWTIIQKRTSGPKGEFAQNWTEYANGFGTLEENFWIGLENIRALTQNGDQELRIELEDFEGEKKYAKYSNFSISDASDFYRLTIDGFSGDAKDSMTDPTYGSSNILNGMRFSTKDKDNDKASGNCAVTSRGDGGWWFNACSASNLNGLYFEKGETVSYDYGIFWWSWKSNYQPLAKTEMKIRTRKS